MRTFILLIALCLFGFAAGQAKAQPDVPQGEVTAQPVCFSIENTAPYTVYGSFVTDVYTMPDGTPARHHEEFRLESRHFAQFCSSGPFYPGRKLDLQLRSLFPVFECRTGVNGTITIHGQQDGNSVKTWADCL